MSRGRGLAAAALAAAALGATGCGNDGKAAADAADPLSWAGSPVAYAPKDLATDRVVLAKVRNTSKAPVRLEAAKLVVRDAGGHALKSSGRFIGGYGHGLYGAFQKPDPLPPDELKRMGIAITLQPGATAPLSIAWRLQPGAKAPVHVEYGAGQLPLPQAARRGS